MHRRTFVAGALALVGGGKLGWEYLNPDVPTPEREDIKLAEKHLEVDTPPGEGDVGTGLAYVRVESRADFPIAVHATFELLKDGKPYEYGYQHEQTKATVSPSETAVLAESWTLDEFPDSTEATGLRVADLSLSNPNNPL